MRAWPISTLSTLIYFYSFPVSCLINSTKKVTPPNIVIFFADNLGYNDIGAFGAPTARTPNIDKLAEEGIKLNNWNSAAALCSASRAALLTGKYPVRTGVYPAVFKPDAVNGLSPNETTIAEYLKEEVGYATSIVGKWHLGHREEFLPTNQGFDEWFGIPYHMSGGSIDDHVCGYDANSTMWLPLFEGTKIVEQPVDLTSLAERYASAACDFITRNAKQPFFLYVPFSHVHQMCAPQQATCQWASKDFSPHSPNATFTQAVEEMDWIAGEILQVLDDLGISDNTLVIFTSDNGPWVAEQSCSGSKGPFEGRWLRDHVDDGCTACPLDYIHVPTTNRPRQCVYPGKESMYNLDGVHCGEDTGLGSVWEANLRMPALARWPGRIARGQETMVMVSTLDVLPTVLSIVGIDIPPKIDGQDITNILLQSSTAEFLEEYEKRVLYFWRDGFQGGPLPAPYGRFDVVAAKLGRIKAWFYTKSSHYNADIEVFHDPPLLFDILEDPAEAFPLRPEDHIDTIENILDFVKEHKGTIDWTVPLTIAQDPRYIPCFDPSTNCRTRKVEYIGLKIEKRIVD